MRHVRADESDAASLVPGTNPHVQVRLENASEIGRIVPPLLPRSEDARTGATTHRPIPVEHLPSTAQQQSERRSEQVRLQLLPFADAAPAARLLRSDRVDACALRACIIIPLCRAIHAAVSNAQACVRSDARSVCDTADGVDTLRSVVIRMIHVLTKGGARKEREREKKTNKKIKKNERAYRTETSHDAVVCVFLSPLCQ